ncbi:MAG: nitroreductase family protein [Candidatus Omnitrophica bacterium]|nr:nitroreductase family protein [Candidatus Omnitrophota bacterium]
MEILNLIKNRLTVREYKKEKIPSKKLQQIIEAGIWSSSVHGFQPWEFIIVSNPKIIKRVGRVIANKAKKIGHSIDRMMLVTAKTINNSPAIIGIFNQHTFRESAKRIFKIKQHFIGIAEQTEIQAISAAIQNMVLTASSLGLACCWNTLPLFCEKEIKKILHTENSLVAILTLGIPMSEEEVKRTPRKLVQEKVKIIK